MTYRKRIAQFATKAVAFPSARIAVAVFALLAGGSATASSANTDAPLKSAIAGEQRSAAHKQRDAARHPYETLQFFGIRPDMHVVEIIPGGGWYTEILAPYLRDHGKLILAAPDPASASDYSRRSAANLKKKLDASPAVFDQVSVGVFEPPANIHFADNNSVDMVLTFRNVHNWAADGDATVQSVFQHIYDSLKPGGVFGVVDHRLPVAQTQDAKASSGYLHQSYVVDMAKRVGFRLAASAEINANPKDHADHNKGVWSLPPTLANQDVDKARYEAIGESDRMTLKFIKP